MVVAEVLTGIALVQQSVKFIKENINTAKDLGAIAGQIDNLLTGEKQVQEQRAKKSGVSIGDQFGIKSVAQEVIDARLAQEQVQEMLNKPLYVSYGDNDEVKWVYEIRTLEVRSKILADGSAYPSKKARSNNDEKSSNSIHKLSLTFLDNQLIKWEMIN